MGDLFGGVEDAGGGADAMGGHFGGDDDGY
jgi:hypothetical protein